MRETIGIIGLGRIGLPAGRAYLAAGYRVAGYDVRPEALEELKSAGGTPLKSPRQVASESQIVLILVLNDEQVRAVVDGEKGLLAGIGRDSAIVCMSTVNRSLVQALAAECEARNISFVDCPFTGGPARIPARTLTLIAAARMDHVEKVRQALEVLGYITYAGSEPGVGQAVKHCNQLLVSATHAVTMEIILLARKLALDPVLVSRVLASGIAGSDYFRLLSESVLQKTPSPGGLGQMCKDVAIVKNTLDQVGLNARVGSAVAAYFEEAAQRGMQGSEGSELITVVEQLAAGRG